MDTRNVKRMHWYASRPNIKPKLHNTIAAARHAIFCTERRRVPAAGRTTTTPNLDESVIQ